jgi:hypothetical protein
MTGAGLIQIDEMGKVLNTSRIDTVRWLSEVQLSPWSDGRLLMSQPWGSSA